MSRIGKKPISIPGGVTVTLDGSRVMIRGPKGSLERSVNPLVRVDVANGVITVSRQSTDRKARAMQGLTRTLVQNMVAGVVEPFKKSLEISGVGYRAELAGGYLDIQVGFSHEVHHPIPPEVTCVVEKQTLIHLTSPNKEVLGRTAAEIRAYRRCEPYQGKGIKYVGERVRRKEGKKTA